MRGPGYVTFRPADINRNGTFVITTDACLRSKIRTLRSRRPQPQLLVSMEAVVVEARKGLEDGMGSTLDISNELQWHLLHLQPPTQPQSLASGDFGFTFSSGIYVCM